MAHSRIVARGTAIAFIVSALAGCATPYQDMGFRGGVDELQLNDTTYRIIARANAYSKPERAQDFALLRACQIAMARGYKGFVVTNATDQSRVITGTYTTGGEVPSVDPAVTHIYTSVKPGTAMIVTLVQEGGLDARMIYAELATKYIADKSPKQSVQQSTTDGKRLVQCKAPDIQQQDLPSSATKVEVSAQQLNTTIKNLEDHSLPTLMQQYGAEQGVKVFNERIRSMFVDELGMPDPGDQCELSTM